MSGLRRSTYVAPVVREVWTLGALVSVAMLAVYAVVITGLFLAVAL